MSIARRTVTLHVDVVVALCCSLALSGCSAPGRSGPTTAPGVNVTDDDRSRVWFGAPSPGAVRASHALSALADEHEDLTAGVSLTSDSQRVEVYVTREGLSLVGSMREAVGASFDALVSVVEVEHSLDDLRTAQSAVTDETRSALDITQVAPDVVNNALAVDVSDDAWAALSPDGDVIELKPGVQGAASLLPGIDVDALGITVLIRECTPADSADAPAVG